MIRIFAVTASLVAAAAIGALSYTLVSSDGSKTVVRQVTVTGAQPAAAAGALSVTDVYNRSSKGVVEVEVSGTAPGPFGEQRTQQGQGSGFVYDGNGHIVTNQHVVGGANAITVKFWNGSTYRATLIGADPSTDLAVLKVDAPGSVLHTLPLGNSGALEVGEGVVAIGSPFGLEDTVTAGIVSALHREMTAPNNFTIADSIQTDAAINHGNSGGPLLDLTGKVIGVNAQIESDSGDNAGVGFAIPSNTVRSIVTQLITDGSVRHAYLGVTIAQGDQGITLTEVRTGGPAAGAGLQVGDVITEINGVSVTQPIDLTGSIDARKPGDRLSLTYLRDGKTRTVQVKLAARPS